MDTHQQFDLNPLFHTWWSHFKEDQETPELISASMQKNCVDSLSLRKQLISFSKSITGLDLSPVAETGNCDFYRDCISRHLGKNRVAFKLVEEIGIKEWTFEQIHSYVNYESARWRRREICQNKRCAIVLPFGIHSVVALLTAVKLGIPFLFLPTDSLSLSEKTIHGILDRFSPDYVISDRRYCSLFPSLLIDYLEEEKEEEGRGHIYTPQEILQYAIACYLQKPKEILPIEAGEMYFNALRDSLFYLKLTPETTWAYPLACPLKEQPCNLFAALIAGATTLYIPSTSLYANPSLLKKETVHVLGLSSAFQRLLENKECVVPRKGLKFFYQNPFSERLLAPGQEKWIIEKELEKVPFGSLLIDNASAGVCLASPPTIHKNGRAKVFFPALGMPWDLEHIHQNGMKSSSPYGVLEKNSSFNKEESSRGNLILVPFEKGWRVGGTCLPHRGGETFPIESIEKEVKELDFVLECKIISLPFAYEVSLEQKLILLVFIQGEWEDKFLEDKKIWNEQIHERIQTGVAPFFIPDQIEYYPSYCILREKQNATNWYAFQHSEGILEKKKRLHLYRLLEKMRKSINEVYQ